MPVSDRLHIDEGVRVGLAIHFGLGNIAEPEKSEKKTVFRLHDRAKLAIIDYKRKTVIFCKRVIKKCPEEVEKMKNYLFIPCGFTCKN